VPDAERHNPTGRFSGLADLYARHRPGYPDAAINRIVARCGLGPTSRLVDVGCGTGISTRLFAARGIPVVGIEPNAEMRARAEAEAALPGGVVPQYRDGRGEATGLASGEADAVLAAQAFHWFDAAVALREFHRVLKPGGWVALMWNERDESDPGTAAYGAVVRTGPDAAAVEGPRGKAGEALLATALFEDAERVAFRYEQPLDEEGLLGRAFSASYAPREPAAAAAFAAALRRVFADHQRGGRVALHYVTSVYLGRRRDPATFYTGVILDDDSRARLLDLAARRVPADYQRLAHHMTINLGPLDAALNPPAILGSTVTLRAVSWALDGRVAAVGVASPVRSANRRPHVTLACNRGAGGEPKHSNDLTDWAPLEEAFDLRGVVRETLGMPAPTGAAGVAEGD
jgi:SAM-dependent methyltransferase